MFLFQMRMFLFQSRNFCEYTQLTVSPHPHYYLGGSLCMRGRKPFNPAAMAEPLWTTVAARGCSPTVVASPSAAKLGTTAKPIFC